MPPDPDDRTAAPPGRPSWGAFADAVGHCLLVFTLLPPLAVVPGWLSGEAHDPLNVRNPIVLAFLPARGALAVLDAFRDGIVGRLLAGTVAGVLLAAASRRAARSAAARMVLGAFCGALAACAAGLLLAASGHAPPPGSMPLGLAGAVASGVVAAPRAVRFVRLPRESRAASEALQRGDASPSASHQ